MGSSVYLVTIVLLAFAGRCCVAQQQRAIFSDCNTEATTELCNNDLSDIYYSVCEPEVQDEYAAICYTCILSPCTITPEGGETPGGDGDGGASYTCAEAECVSDVCNPFSLFSNNRNSFSVPCRDVYDEQYCSYCEACSSSSNSSTSCSTDYTTTFCRLMPETLNPNCYQEFGVDACDLCAAVLDEQTCDRLTYSNITQEQNTTLCSIAGSCASLPPSINCTANQVLDCQLCTYLMIRDACDFTPDPNGPNAESCSTVEGLYCSLVNTYGEMCPQQVSSDTCTFCATEYPNCLTSVPDIREDSSLNNTLCNSSRAASCGDSVSLDYDTCNQNSEQSECDFCKATFPVCNYQIQPMDNGNNSNINCSSDTYVQCGYDLTYFPCSLIYGLNYCQGCGEAIQTCGEPQYDIDFVPPNLCDSDIYVSLCYDIINLNDCSSVVDETICSFCQDVVNTTCTLPANVEVGLDHLCSPSSFLTCFSILDGNEFCTENDCYICRSRGTICESNEVQVGSGDSCSSDSTTLFCRVHGSNFTNCLSNFDSGLCQQCQTILISCSSLEIADLSDSQLQIACQDTDTCIAATSAVSLCEEELYSSFCSVCSAFENVCQPFASENAFNNETCAGDAGILFCRAFASNLTSCLSRFSSSLCSDCQSVFFICPALDVNDFTNEQIESACELSNECDVIFHSPSLCQLEDYASLCDICLGFRDICPQTGSGLSSVCISESGIGCSFVYNYQPCYLTESTSTCDYCGAVVDLCPNLAFNIADVPPEVCGSIDFVASCSIIANDPICESVYGDDTCNYCKLVFEECPQPDNYTTIVEIFDEACESDFDNCTDILEAVDAGNCMDLYTFSDCGFCTALATYCPGRNANPVNCSSDYDLFCGYITSSDDCGQQYFPSTCQDCDDYNDECSNNTPTSESDLIQLCSSNMNLFACANIPIGSTCRHLVPEESFLCDYCNLYAEVCTDTICSDSNLRLECSNLYDNGIIPNTYSDSGSDQCLPCALVSSLCNDTFVSVSPSMSPSVSLPVSAFLSSSIFSFSIQPSSSFPPMFSSVGLFSSSVNQRFSSMDILGSPSPSFSPVLSQSVILSQSVVLSPSVSLVPSPFISSSVIGVVSSFFPSPVSSSVIVTTETTSTTTTETTTTSTASQVTTTESTTTSSRLTTTTSTSTSTMRMRTSTVSTTPTRSTSPVRHNYIHCF